LPFGTVCILNNQIKLEQKVPPITHFRATKLPQFLKYFDNQSYLQTPDFNANIAVSKQIDEGGYGYV